VEWVVEVGPGTNHTYPFRPQARVGSNVVFVDIEPPAPELKEHGEWIVADAQHLPLRDACCSTVYASHILEHLSDPWGFLTGCRQVLKPRGLLHLALPNFLSVNARRDPAHRHVYNVISLALMLKKVGFIVHFEHRAGSLLPGPLRKAVSTVINFFAEEIRLVGERP